MTTNENVSPLTAVPTESDEQPSWGSAPTVTSLGSGSEAPEGSAPDAAFQPPFPPPLQPRPLPARAFFDAVRGFGATRSDRGSGRMVAGVASGLARRLNVDPTILRIAFIVLTFVGGLGASLYGLAWLFLPQQDGRIHAQQLLTGKLTAGFVGALLATLAVTDGGWSVVVAAVAVTLVVVLARSRNQSAGTAATTH